MDSPSGAETDGSGKPAVESLWESLALLPRRALFVAVALVQIAVELAAGTVGNALTKRDDAPSA